MVFFARAVITGFGFTLGALLLRKAAQRLGIEDPAFPQATAKAAEVAPGNGESPPVTSG